MNIHRCWGMVLVGLLLVVQSSMADEQKTPTEAISDLVVKFVEDINQQHFDDAKRLFHAAGEEEWESLVARFKSLKDAMGTIEITELSHDQVQKMKREGQYMLEWGRQPNMTDREMLMANTFAVRFGDGSVGMAKGSVLLGRNLTTIPKGGFHLVQFQLLAPTTNRKFEKLCKSFGELKVITEAPAVVPNEEKVIHPLVTLTGTDSHIRKCSYYLVRSDEEWVKVWLQHRPTNSSNECKPEIDFEKCMVIAVFQGSGWNSRGLNAVAVLESKNRILLRLKNDYYQTGGPDGGGEPVTVYGFFVLPRSNKTVVLEENVQNIIGSPPLWKERARFNEARNQRDEFLNQPLPPQIMLPGAPKTARDIEEFRSLRKTMTMADVVRKCGLPDQHTGSGIYIFVYRLRDGNTVMIGTADLKSLIYARHVDKSGKSTSLISEPST